MRDLELTVERDHDRVRIICNGDVDIYTAAALKSTCVCLIDEGATHFIVDLANVPYIDSSCLGVLVGLRRRLGERDGSVALANPTPSVYTVLETYRLTRIFDIWVGEELRRAGDVSGGGNR